MKLYQYAIILKPTKKELLEGTGKHELLVKPTDILAGDDNAAMLQAARAIPEKYLECLDRIEVAVRPF